MKYFSITITFCLILVSCLGLVDHAYAQAAPGAGMETTSLGAAGLSRFVSFPPKSERRFIGKYRMNLFPNPAMSDLQIDLPIANKQGFELQVFNSQGFSMITQKWTGEKLDVSQLPPGHYVVVLRKDKLIFSQKLVVARE